LLFIDEITIQEGSLLEALGWAAAAVAGLGVLMPMLWWRIHMWDHFAAATERRQSERYRAKDFVE
jgi:hypothetical protein